MPFAHLKRDTLRQVKQAFDDAGKTYDEDLRGLMLQRTEYQANLKPYKTPFLQLAGDVSALNSIEFLTDSARTVPFKAWLENGKELFTPLPQAQVFENALAELLAGPAEPASAKTIVEGLAALSDLIESDDFAHDAVLFYRRIFETAVKEFEIIADYKRMHDALHKLELGWPDISAMLSNVAAKIVPKSMVEVTLDNSFKLFSSTITDLEETYKRRFVDVSENKWMDNLRQERVELQQAIENDDMGAIPIVFSDIRAQLGDDLSWLNKKLKEAVTVLHLKDLINSMTDLCVVLKEVASERASRPVEQYAAGVEEMTKLDDELSKLIIQHDEWQRNEDILRTLGSALTQSTDAEGERNTATEIARLGQLQLILSVIQIRVIPLLGGQTSMLAKRLSNSTQKLDELIKQKDADNAEDVFYMYREQARLFFFDLDTGLKTKCEELRRIGQTLRQVNAELQATPVEV